MTIAPPRGARRPIRSSSVRARGFTLIEVMIVAAIIGVLVGIAYPAYGKYVRDTRRSDGHLALLQEVQAMERCRSTTFSYASPPCTLSRDPATSEQGFYTLSLDSDVNSYTLTAKGIAVQANDTECLEMTIDHRDQKLPAACWD